MVNAERPVELWRLQIGQDVWRCALDADAGCYRVNVMRQDTVVASRAFADEALATWWAALERAELLN